MKLEKILDKIGAFDKNSFIKIIDNIISNKPKNYKAIEKILSSSDKGLKSAESKDIVKIFKLTEDEFAETVRNEFIDTSSQLDILIDIITRDGNCIMKQDWFSRLYENEIKGIQKKIRELKSEIENEKSNLDEDRKRDYNIYRSCVNTAYINDITNNRDETITDDELSILITLANELELSQEETKLINYMIVPPKRLDILETINSLKSIGAIFYYKKENTVYVADEIVRTLRKIRGKDVADKYLRRILRILRVPEVNLIAKKHHIERTMSNDEKIREIIKEGIGLKSILNNDVYKHGTNVSEKKVFINELWSKGLQLKPALKGTLLEEKISNLISYFENREKDEKVGISIDGYEKMLSDLNESLPKLNKKIKDSFELQSEFVLKSEFLLDFNIKPRDILDLIPKKEILKFCKDKDIKTRGDEIINILDNYKDVDNLYLENYELIGFRNLNELKENGIELKESELGIKFEDLTKTIFTGLGFNVDESLKKKLNTKKDKMDVLINLGNNELIIIECKTVKEKGYNKFSSVSRQLKSYYDLAKKNNYKVIKSLLVAPDFSDDFIGECELEFDLNLSLMKALSLKEIFDGFKRTNKHSVFPYKLLLRDVLINEQRILKAITK